MDDEAEICSMCNGSGVSKANIFHGTDMAKEDYQPIECQRCGGFWA